MSTSRPTERFGGLSAGRRSLRVHFVGIGGIGMSGIAELLLNLGCSVSGSDLSTNDTTRRLGELGASITLGHEPARVSSDIDVLVTSSAVKSDNPEVVRARELKVPVIPRAEMLAELMRMRTGVAIAGTHGKTTTTSLVATVLHEAGLDPTMVVGGKLRTLGTNARLGQGEFLVAEADESDGSFLMLNPVVTVVTNIDPEHLDYYGTMDAARDAYLTFINRVPFYGVAILCVDSENIRQILPDVRKPVRTYGESEDAEYQARNVTVEGFSTCFDVWRRGERLGSVTLQMPGRHHALNALAALAVADHLGLSFEQGMRGLGRFAGIHRRFELIDDAGGIMVVEDYGHHPTEIAATIRAAREGFRRRIVVAFQPHRFTRTRDLFEQFVDAFDEADVLVLTDIYAAGEKPITGVTGERVFEVLREKSGVPEVRYVADRGAIAAALHEIARAGDLVLILGAGDIANCGSELAQLVRAGTSPTVGAR